MTLQTSVQQVVTRLQTGMPLKMNKKTAVLGLPLEMSRLVNLITEKRHGSHIGQMHLPGVMAQCYTRLTVLL